MGIELHTGEHIVWSVFWAWSSGLGKSPITRKGGVPTKEPFPMGVYTIKPILKRGPGGKNIFDSQSQGREAERKSGAAQRGD